MTKADYIRTLYAEGRQVREIATIVGCSTEYVRVSARQRKDGKPSAADINYRPIDLDEHSKERARKAARAAFAEGRRLGLSVRQSNVLAVRARSESLRASTRLHRASVQKALTGARESDTNHYSRE